MDSERQKIYNQAIKYLGLRSHTIFELRTKLSRKKFPLIVINDVLDELVARKYVDDRVFAQIFVQNLVKYKTFGYFGVKMKLRQRGVEDSVADEVLEEELSLEQETKIARRAIGKKQHTDKAKLMQMLQRKGFRGQVIARVTGGQVADGFGFDET
jgi:regulatory protein